MPRAPSTNSVVGESVSTATWRVGVGVGVGVCVVVGVRVMGWGVANKLMDEELLVCSVLSEVWGSWSEARW
jgi:hypothetical protein